MELSGFCKVCGLQLEDVLRCYCSRDCLDRDREYVDRLTKLNLRRQAKVKATHSSPRKKQSKFKYHPTLLSTGMTLHQAIFNGSFYQLREWRELAFKYRVQHPRKCMCCGRTEGEMHVDHIKPKSRYPDLALSIDNLQILCRDCNLGKSNKHTTDFRPTKERVVIRKPPNETQSRS